MCTLTEKITKGTGISFNIVGVDKVSGMPALRGLPHPEAYQTGWYPMEAPDRLRAKLPATAKLILGEIASTVPEFL